MSSGDPRLGWAVAFERYVSTVRMGGTPEQRVWAWARANDALDKLMRAEPVAGLDTEEMGAV